MKGLRGIMIALALGVLGAASNWFYLAKQADRMQKVSFVMIASNAQINLGDRFKSHHFDHVDIPRHTVGNLDKAGVLWQDRHTIIGMAATRSYIGGEILLRQDLKTPAHRDLSSLLGEDEGLRWVPVDQRTFVPEHVNPGDWVSFIVSGLAARVPTPASGTGVIGSAATQTIGPFEILALGTRKGRREYLQAKRATAGQEHLIGIRVKVKDGQLDPLSQKLFELIRQSGNQGVQVLLHSAKTKKKPGS